MKEEDVNSIPKIVIVGHVDHGKSSFIGRLIHDLGQVPDGKYDELKRVCERRGGEFEYAYLLDALQTERDQGVTIDTTQIFFKTKKSNYVFIDAPGHKEFIRNMITGASSADLALLIVDVAEGIKEQTKKHAYILKILGIKGVICLFNKMDKINYDKKIFLRIKKELTIFLKKLDVSLINSIPISAKFGENLVTKSKKMNWYKKQPFIEILDNFKINDHLESKNFRLPVQDIYKSNDKRIIVGRVESGKVSINDKILFSPSNEEVSIKSFEAWPKAKNFYSAGECVGFTIDEQIFVDTGNMVSHKKNPPKLMHTFESNVFWIGGKKLLKKKKYYMKINTGEYLVSVEKILNVIDTNTLNANKNPTAVNKNEICELVLYSPQLIPMDDFSTNPRTGRFCLLDEEEIVAGGIVNIKNFPDQRENKNETISNIVPFDYSVKEIDRISKLSHRPGIVWLTGLSGSGKSTIAKEIEKRLFMRDYNVFILDGDNLRLGLNKGLSFSPDDRTENIRRTGEVAKLFSQAGFIVIVSLISPYKSERKKARDIRPEIFKEVYIKASLEECIKRDTKGLYLKARKGEIENFTGISSPYEEPEKPDLVIDTEKDQINRSVDKLENFVINEFGMH